VTIFFGVVFGMLAKCGCGRSLLMKFPGFFSGGTDSKDGVAKEMAENTNFIMTLVRICEHISNVSYWLARSQHLTKSICI